MTPADLPRAPSFRLDGRRAPVSGASRGIGPGGAVALAEAGPLVVCAARDPDALSDAVAAMRTTGLTAEALVLDLADLDTTRAAVSRLGPCDIVLNAAGLARHAPALDTAPADFDTVFAVNIRAAHFPSHAVQADLTARGRSGAIIHISSQTGHVGGQDRAVYAAGKRAVEGMVKSMAIEGGAVGIRVNTICPTCIRTPQTQPTRADPAKMAWIGSRIKLGRTGEVTDVMGAAAFLASDAAAMITGTALMIDGGWMAG